MISEPDDSAQGDSRRDRRRRRRTRRGLFVLGAVVGALAVAGTALALTGIVEVGRDAPSAGAGGPARSTTSTAAADGAVAPESSCRSPLDPFDPLRLWIGGDSLAGSLGPSLGRMTADTGVVQPVYFSKVSSGLSTPDFWDWPKHAREEMFKLDPEVTVFIVGANDTMIVTDEASEWRPAYEQAVEEMMQILIGEGRTVYWVGSPILEDDDDLAVAQLNQVFIDVAARHPEVVYVDAYALFSGPDGEYTDTVTDVEGETIRVRADDGVHFTPEGGDHLAEAVLASLEPQCSLLAQAVPGAAKDVIETEGSSRVPGTSRDNSTVTTSAPRTVATTAPPVTDPPTTTTLPPETTPTTIPIVTEPSVPVPDGQGQTGTG